MELDCLALTIYFEARGEPLQGKLAVGYVVINRVGDKEFPANVCQVVQQGGEAERYRCQFSWWCDGRSDKPVDLVAWRKSRAVAWEVLSGESDDPTRGALWYHTHHVQPDWRNKLVKIHKIGDHLFYRRP
jgi:spore germination cell wall hydrolase CwlJ-like protein